MTEQQRIAGYLKWCAASAVGSRSPFNQGVVRGLELAAAQVELGHYQGFPFASGMEAPSGGETPKSGSTEGDSPTAESGDAQ